MAETRARGWTHEATPAPDETAYDGPSRGTRPAPRHAASGNAGNAKSADSSGLTCESGHESSERTPKVVVMSWPRAADAPGPHPAKSRKKALQTGCPTADCCTCLPPTTGYADRRESSAPTVTCRVGGACCCVRRVLEFRDGTSAAGRCGPRKRSRSTGRRTRPTSGPTHPLTSTGPRGPEPSISLRAQNTPAWFATAGTSSVGDATISVSSALEPKSMSPSPPASI
jgi:hypothetical protein